MGELSRAGHSGALSRSCVKRMQWHLLHSITRQAPLGTSPSGVPGIVLGAVFAVPLAGLSRRWTLWRLRACGATTGRQPLACA